MNKIFVLATKRNTKTAIKKLLNGFNIVFKDKVEEVYEEILENKVPLLLFEEDFLDEILHFYDRYVNKLEHIICNSILILNGDVNRYNINDLMKYNIISVLEQPIEYNQLILAIGNGQKIIDCANNYKKLAKDNAQYLATIKTLNELGIALTTEKNIGSLLSNILRKIRWLTNSDSGSIYIIDEGHSLTESERELGCKIDGSISKNLVVKISQNDSVTFNFREIKVPISRHSLAGYVALEAKPLNIIDAYKIPDDVDYHFYKQVDVESGYKTKSLLILPMMNPKNELIGIISIINRKRNFNVHLKDMDVDVERYVIPYDKDVELSAMSVASQAAIAIENVQLVENVSQLFEGFVTASVKAIEQRDPLTSGHSEHVAKLSLALAEEITKCDKGRYKNIKFNTEQLLEIKYAALLHDFGKVGVKEHVLLKANKLYDWELDNIKERCGYLKEYVKNAYLQKKIDFILENGNSKCEDFFSKSDIALNQRYEEIDYMFEVIKRLNIPSSHVREEDMKMLYEIANIELPDYSGETRYFLSELETTKLSIKYGTLTEDELREVESHVTHSYEFLREIPWLNTLSNIPKFAYCHHEKLNGEGYPRGLKTDEIPIQSKIITVADIFDSLTAPDRPYKAPVDLDNALNILRIEAKASWLDEEIVDLFISHELFRVIGFEPTGMILAT